MAIRPEGVDDLNMSSINGLRVGAFVRRDTHEAHYATQVGKVVELDVEGSRCRVAWPSMFESDFGKITRTWYKASKLLRVTLQSDIPDCLKS